MDQTRIESDFIELMYGVQLELILTSTLERHGLSTFITSKTKLSPGSDLTQVKGLILSLGYLTNLRHVINSNPLSLHHLLNSHQQKINLFVYIGSMRDDMADNRGQCDDGSNAYQNKQITLGGL